MYNYNHISNKNQFIFGGYCIMSRYKLNCELAQMLKGKSDVKVDFAQEVAFIWNRDRTGGCPVGL